MYLAYNTVAVEKLGKPAVMMLNRAFVHDAATGASVKELPGLRLLPTKIPTEVGAKNVETIRATVTPIMDELIATMTRPLTEEEASPKAKKEEQTSRLVFKGNLEEVNRFFYKRGWCYGLPIIPPTEEKVAEMLTGTDLPADHVVAKLPPRMGKATVERIAVNAVMAGALPVHMPVLIAAVKAIVDPRMTIEGYICSVASWAPLLIINGPIRRDLNVNSGLALMSPYYIANAAIGHAMGLIIQNIAGTRAGVEDMAAFGHEGKFGMCFAENEEDSPWEALHVESGLNKRDNAVTVFYPNVRQILPVHGDATNILNGTCNHIKSFGFNPGSALIMTPGAARTLAGEGWSKKQVISYIGEYARVPEYTHPWSGRTAHVPKELIPVDPTLSRRIFLTTNHIIIVVAGGSMEQTWVVSYGGGGDYGGPITKKIELPENWDKLLEKYKNIVPTYARY